MANVIEIEKSVEERYASISLGGKRNSRAPHKPLMLLWAIARCLQGKERIVSFDFASSRFMALLNAFGPHRVKRAGAEYPFWHLKNDDGVWEALSPTLDEIPRPTMARLRKHDVRGGLSEADYALFQAKPEVAWKAASILIDRHFPESLRDALLSAAGFDLANHPPENATVSSRALRTRAFAAAFWKCTADDAPSAGSARAWTEFRSRSTSAIRAGSAMTVPPNRETLCVYAPFTALSSMPAALRFWSAAESSWRSRPPPFGESRSVR